MILKPHVTRIPANPEPAPVEQQLELLARLMDSAFRLPGTDIRFGLDALIGLFPGVGDTLTSLVSLYILSAASRLGVPRVTLARMALNIAIDSLVGSIPLAGDLFDVAWKANLKNVELLRRHSQAGPTQARKAKTRDGLFLLALCSALLLLLAGSIASTIWLITWIARHIG